MNLKSYAKINLTLDILGKREDNFHEIESIMQQVSLADDITLESIKEDKIILECSSKELENENNLAYKAALLLKTRFNIKRGVKIKIKKNIPTAAGLSGGSSNAAAILKALKRMWKIHTSEHELSKLGSELGSDVPFHIFGKTCLIKGRGEIVEPLENFPSADIVIINPGFEVSTKEAYAEICHAEPCNIKATQTMLKEPSWTFLHNDFEALTIKKHKVIAEIKTRLKELGAVNSLMSGSGPTVFGIFKDIEIAQKAEEALKLKYPFVYLARTLT